MDDFMPRLFPGTFLVHFKIKKARTTAGKATGPNRRQKSGYPSLCWPRLNCISPSPAVKVSASLHPLRHMLPPARCLNVPEFGHNMQTMMVAISFDRRLARVPLFLLDVHPTAVLDDPCSPSVRFSCVLSTCCVVPSMGTSLGVS